MESTDTAPPPEESPAAASGLDASSAKNDLPTDILSPIEKHQLMMLLQGELAQSINQMKKSQRMAHSDTYRAQQLQQTRDRCRERTAEKMGRAEAKRAAIIQQKNLQRAMAGSVTQAKQSNASSRLDEADQRLREQQEKNREIARKKCEKSAIKRQLLVTEKHLQLEQTRADRQARSRIQAEANERYAKEVQQARRERTEERFKRTEASRQRIETLKKYREMAVAAEISQANELERQRLAEQEQKKSEMQRKRADQIKVSHERKLLFDKVSHHIQKGTDPRKIAKMFSLELPEPGTLQQSPSRPKTARTVKHRPTPPPTPADQKEDILSRISTPSPGGRYYSKWVYD